MRTLMTATALALCTSGLVPVAVAQADAASASDNTADTATPIKHLVVVFQENASFDHYFGTYPLAANPPGDPPFTALPDTPTVNNLLPSDLNGNRDLRTTNPNAALPFRLERSQFITCSQSHTYRPEERAADLGRMDRFVQATDNSGCALPRPVPSPQVMGYFDGNTVTALWNYAQHYALEDNAFGTTYGPSTPGALNLVAGRTSGATSNTNDNKVVTDGTVFGDPDPLLDDCADLPQRATVSGPNVGDLLTAAGVSWGWFQGGFRRTNALDAPVRRGYCDGEPPATWAGKDGGRLRGPPRPVPVLRVDGEPPAPAADVRRQHRARRPGPAPVRPRGLLDRRQERRAARRQLPQGAGLPGRPPRVAELQPARRAGLPRRHPERAAAPTRVE